MKIFNNPKTTAFVNNRITRKALSILTDYKTLPFVILLEAGVTGGRTYQAHKRNGYDESRERFTEEVLAAIVWLGGIKGFNHLGNYICDKLLSIKNIKTDIGHDYVRNPINLLAINDAGKKSLTNIKVAKIAISAAAAIYTCGAIIPRLNQYLTKKHFENKNHKAQNNNSQPNFKGNGLTKNLSINDFISITSKKQIAFKGDLLKTLGYAIENDDIVKLLTTDIGVTGGRAIHARNKDERREILFRDLASMFFYMKSTPLVFDFLSKRNAYKGKNTGINTEAARYIDNHLRKCLAHYKIEKIEDFRRTILGPKESNIESTIQKTLSESIYTIQKDKKVFAEKMLAIEGIEKIFGKDSRVVRNAKNLSLLNPGHEGKAITYSQIRMLESAAINRNGFLERALGLVINDKEITKTVKKIERGQLKEWPQNIGLKDKSKFIKQKNLDEAYDACKAYIETVFEEAANAGKTKIEDLPEILTKMKNRNFIMRLGYVSAGLAISSLFLSYLIPKTQYLMTKIITGKNEFPGIREYKK